MFSSSLLKAIVTYIKILIVNQDISLLLYIEIDFLVHITQSQHTLYLCYVVSKLSILHYLLLFVHHVVVKSLRGEVMSKLTLRLSLSMLTTILESLHWTLRPTLSTPCASSGPSLSQNRSSREVGKRR